MSDADKAFHNIALRLMGEDVPVFNGIKKLRRKRVQLYK